VDTAAGPMLLVICLIICITIYLGRTAPTVVVNSNCSNLDELPTITFVFGDTDYPFYPSDYVVKTVVDGVTQCSAPLGTSAVGTNLVLGTLWTQAYYSMFDIDNRVMGFARSIPTP